MRPPEEVVTQIEQLLNAEVRSIDPVGGGCIANASRLRTDRQTFFLKWALGPGGKTFVAEGMGLGALTQAMTSLVVPEPIGTRVASQENLGIGLAELHRVAATSTYGFEHDNFIGRLPQKNEPHSDWVGFFVNRRIIPQVEMARRGRRWTAAWDAGLEGLLRSIPSLLPSLPHAALVHGDLWSGNVLATTDSRSAVIDPAVYRGDREVDLAMTELFGGFPPGFYSAYNSTWELDAGYQERRDVYNLYHLINHLNHFGSSYGSQVAGILRRFR